MAIHTQLLFQLPGHASEHNLLKTGSKLAEWPTGINKRLLENVYTSAPMFATGTIMLNEFMLKLKLLKNDKTGSGPIHSLEVGGWTGGSSSRQSSHNHHRRR
ncbi:hypothetical protein BCON_0013g00750 [Botryotinia convoluta]|uniref:Uncharacterized protein n=1 Tax=Botryotinia convoluta TaxID=54673 RepID=A0A4Z1IPF5_9HELO|nr:hypothetical protein BCON_0013g00750 [Botryotinia convoluta]